MSALKKFYPVSDLEKEKIHLKYGKAQCDIEGDVNILKEWLKKQPHIPKIQDDTFLQIFLLRNKYQIEKAKLKLDKYFTVKTVYSRLFLKADPLDNEILLVDNYIEECALPKLAPDGSRIFYLSIKPLKNASDFPFFPVLSYLMSRGENHIVFDYNDSITMIVNSENFSLSIIPQIKLAELAGISEIFLEGYAGRVNSIFIINTIPASEKMYNIIKTILPPKIKNRMNFFQRNSIEKFFELVPKDCLPLEIGGTGPSIKELSREYSEAMRSEREYILNRNQNGTIESKRIGKSTIDMQMFGVDGTFRTINID